MTVYLDMDGVIADFFGKLEDDFGADHWKDIKNIERCLNEIRNTDFFYQIPAFAEAADIVELVKEHSDGDWGICSSPLRDDHYNSAFWKRKWLTIHGFLPDDLEKLIFTSNKHKYAISRLSGKPNVLIDDKPSNINAWEQAGGIGIRFQCNKDDLEYLDDQLIDVFRMHEGRMYFE